MDVAKKMASGGVYLVTESSLEQIGRGGPVTTGACDLSITVKPASGGEQAALCVYKDHTAFTDYAALKSGDKLRFRYVEDVMQKGGSGPREVSFCCSIGYIGRSIALFSNVSYQSFLTLSITLPHEGQKGRMYCTNRGLHQKNVGLH